MSGYYREVMPIESGNVEVIAFISLEVKVIFVYASLKNLHLAFR